MNELLDRKNVRLVAGQVLCNLQVALLVLVGWPFPTSQYCRLSVDSSSTSVSLSFFSRNDFIALRSFFRSGGKHGAISSVDTSRFARVKQLKSERERL